MKNSNELNKIMNDLILKIGNEGEKIDIKIIDIIEDNVRKSYV